MANPPEVSLGRERGSRGAEQLRQTDANVEFAVAHDAQICWDTTTQPPPGTGGTCCQATDG
jgi:hypothetical protein